MAGYEGLQIDGFLNILLEAGIEQIIDVRHNPISRRYGFHKSTLSGVCGRLNIEYKHVPEVGIPSELRANLRQPSDYIPLFQEYEKKTLSSQPLAVERIGKLGRIQAVGLDVYGEQSRFLSQVPSCKDNCKPYGTHGPRPERLQMQTEYTKTKILITVMTYPHPSRGYQELVCTAGGNGRGQLGKIVSRRLSLPPARSKISEIPMD